MDLAKIRKKSLQDVKESAEEHSVSSAQHIDSFCVPHDHVPANISEPLIDFSNIETCSPPSPSLVAEMRASTVTELPERGIAPQCSPIEVILAGRSAAGCEDESSLVDETAHHVVTESCLEFLCFRVADEIYGINIMDIKEIIKPREVTEVPRSPAFVLGVLSLRGIIIPIIDMRRRLGLSSEEPSGKERVVVIKSNNSFSGLLVDEVIQVVQVQLGALEAAPTVLDGIDRDFISGIGRSGGRLIIILNLETIADILLY